MHNKNLTYFPKGLSNKAIATYVISLLAVSILFMQYALPLWLMLFGIISVIVFFHFSNSLSIQWMRFSTKSFEKKLFWTAFIIRLAYVVFIYNLNYYLYGTYYESQEGDINWYVPEASDLCDDILNGGNGLSILLSNVQLDDLGYIIYLSFLYLITYKISIVMLPLLIKIILGSVTCVFIYRLAYNHFNNSIARLSGIFCLLQFNLIWWCGSMMKETEMVFLYIWFAYKADTLLVTNNTKVSSWLIVVIIGLLMFGFRTVLAVISFVSLFGALLFTSSKVISTSRKVVAGILVALMLLLVAGDRVKEQTQSLIETASDTEYQQRNMEWRSKRAGAANQFAKYAGAAVFAPLIFTIPFPSMVYTFESQEMQMMVNGGNYVKNVLSFYVIYSMFFLLFSGEWRKHVFPIALLVGYLSALTLSVFAHSGRFHMPIISLEMMFAAYGLSLVVEKRRLHWFNYVLIMEFMFCVAWSWFKLRGRNMM